MNRNKKNAHTDLLLLLTVKCQNAMGLDWEWGELRKIVIFIYRARAHTQIPVNSKVEKEF